MQEFQLDAPFHQTVTDLVGDNLVFGEGRLRLFELRHRDGCISKELIVHLPQTHRAKTRRLNPPKRRAAKSLWMVKNSFRGSFRIFSPGSEANSIDRGV